MKVVRGVIAVTLIAAAAWWLGSLVPLIGTAAFALLLGIAVGNSVRLPVSLVQQRRSRYPRSNILLLFSYRRAGRQPTGSS